MSMGLKPILEKPALNEEPVHENPILNRILQNRGIRHIDEMIYPLDALIPPSSMLGMDKAVLLLEKHIRAGSQIVIVGDFDCDGATSTSIAVEGLTMMGARDVQFIIPDRMIHGYGLSPSVVKLAAEYEPDLIVTVDNGIASFEGADAVNALGEPTTLEDGTVIPGHPCELLVTDHHLAAEKGLPNAAVIVNPNQPDCPFPSKALAGCGVMFYTIMALRAHLRDNGYFREKGVEIPNIAKLLDLVALGTVADVVALDRNNRILIHAGLKRIRQGAVRPGIKALLDIADKELGKVVATDMGFAVGPRINAAGRLDDMSIGIRCLLEQDEGKAQELAHRLTELNQQRKDIEAHHVFDAGVYIEQHKLMELKGVVIHDASWHAGVVGIVAARIKERLNRPVICMTDTTKASVERERLNVMISEGAHPSEIEAQRWTLDQTEVKGSARSVDGVHMKHVLDHINKTHPEVLGKFGGHAMAAGMSVRYGMLPLFKKLFDDEVSKYLTDEQMLGNITVDIMNTEPEYMTMELCRTISEMGPWGQHFQEPEFHARFRLIKDERRRSPAVLKEKHLRMIVEFADHPGQQFETITFNCIHDGEMPVEDTFDASFGLSINEYPKGKFRLQLMMKTLQDPDLQLRRDQIKAAKEGLERKSTRIAGLPNRDMSNPVHRFQADYANTLDMLRAAPTKDRFRVEDNDPQPF
ncbi:single-stranded-DNA-specific exonuclease RecJ [Pseudomonas fluorescens]|uniref:single-stranded-DNA-specific exonuclease RecJ n=1 Tax=Pseudomonas TaxID=286 RepID=UPI000F02C48F|nr:MULTISPECIES: DHH family phosphoesterase [Pseudomonas]MBD8089301.1 single-stranded-DNA-specific exonuclease RecJ [Pseudomonas fluorescens]MBD8615272.1 single-stranded-DNA-specific exonuclease RecJ [Pseudomonas putida]MBD8682074.1 single-stranded-DNA-specific exonuclease RecJ [Pseudomonas sp. CFBP 13719]